MSKWQSLNPIPLKGVHQVGWSSSCLRYFLFFKKLINDFIAILCAENYNRLSSRVEGTDSFLQIPLIMVSLRMETHPIQKLPEGKRFPLKIISEKYSASTWLQKSRWQMLSRWGSVLFKALLHSDKPVASLWLFFLASSASSHLLGTGITGLQVFLSSRLLLDIYWCLEFLLSIPKSTSQSLGSGNQLEGSE